MCSTYPSFFDCGFVTLCVVLQPELKAKLQDSRYNIAMENHEFGVAPEAFTKWLVLNDTYDILSTSKDRSVLHTEFTL